mgnify:FL=1
MRYPLRGKDGLWLISEWRCTMEECKKNLKEAALQMVSRAFGSMLWGSIVWDNSQVRILNCLLQEGVISREDVSAAVDKGIRASGRASLYRHQSHQYCTPPDHTNSPEALAYALSKGEFTSGEEGTIHFDHGEDKAAFIKSYCRDTNYFLSWMVERVLTEQPSPPLPAERKGSSADWCSDGPCCCDSH